MPKFLDLLVVHETEVLRLYNVILNQRKKKNSNGIVNIYIKIGLLLQEQIETKQISIGWGGVSSLLFMWVGRRRSSNCISVFFLINLFFNKIKK